MASVIKEIQSTVHKHNMPPSRKRGAVKIEPPNVGTFRPTSTTAKKPKVKQEEKAETSDEELREQFISLFSEEQYEEGISNKQLKGIFGAEGLTRLVPIINELSKESRLIMSKMEGNDQDLFYKLVSEEIASKFAGLDANARLV